MVCTKVYKVTFRPRLNYQPLFGKMSPHSSRSPSLNSGSIFEIGTIEIGSKMSPRPNCSKLHKNIGFLKIKKLKLSPTPSNLSCRFHCALVEHNTIFVFRTGLRTTLPLLNIKLSIRPLPVSRTQYRVFHSILAQLVVRKVDNAIHRIDRSPVDNTTKKTNMLSASVIHLSKYPCQNVKYYSITITKENKGVTPLIHRQRTSRSL